MSAVFLCKKILKATVLTLSFVIVLSVFVSACFLAQKRVFGNEKTFYFLFSDDTHVEASTHVTQLMGGAGYVAELDGRQYVAYSVYLDKNEGEKALRSVLVQNATAKLYALQTNALYGNGEETLVKGALDAFWGNIQVLSAEVKRLAEGATQQSTKRIICVVQKQLLYMGKVYEKSFPKCAEACLRTSDELGNVLEDIVFVKDLRYCLCSMCFSYARLCENFRL